MSTPKPLVAVIAVHGVAYHAPGASADAMADLLSSLSDGSQHLYSPFRAQGLRIPLDPVEVLRPVPDNPDPGLFSFVQERSTNFAGVIRKEQVTLAGGRIEPHAKGNALQRASRRALSAMFDRPNLDELGRGAVGNTYMKWLLQGYKGAANGNTFSTTRLEGSRKDASGAEAADVHIYEAYWADLARPTNSVLSFFEATYQLLFHLASLSRISVDTAANARASREQQFIWSSFQGAQRYAVRMLQLPIPILNVILLVTALSVLPELFLPDRPSVWAYASIAALIGVAAGFWRCQRSKSFKTPATPNRWLLLPVGFAATGAFLAAAVFFLRFISSTNFMAMEWWLVGAVFFKMFVESFAKTRAGAQQIGWFLFTLTFIAFLVNLQTAQDFPQPLSQATIWTIQWILAGLRLSWMLLVGFAIAASLLGSIAWRTSAKGDARNRARAAVRTSRLALALSTLCFLLLTVFLWGGMSKVVTQNHNLYNYVEPILPPGGKWLAEFHLVLDPADSGREISCASNTTQEKPSAGLDAREYFKDSLVWSVGTGLPLTLGLASAALLLLVWWAIPAVLTETFPLRGVNEAPRKSSDAESFRLGAWMSRGLDATGTVTFLFWYAMFVIPVVFDLSSSKILKAIVPGIDRFLQSSAVLSDSIVCNALGVGASVAALALIVRYSSSALGIVLDVDNYLRTSPAEATPRAKIMERYVSVLRYVAAYRDTEGRGYSSVVIVAHSLGALISADLLRFLCDQEDLAKLGFGKAPGGVPITLFTMGNPLRQLLNRFFPYLYDWVRDSPDNGGACLPVPTEKAPISMPAGTTPKPEELGVERWLNAYRSGDYVGRSLWTDEWYGRLEKGLVNVTEGSKTEFCIGAGAHQHYWDDTAKDIAEELNSLIG